MRNNKNKLIYEYNKRFTNGEQFITISNYGDIIEEEKQFFWQERRVYNHIKPIIECLKAKYKLTESQLYGPNSIVTRLVPIQQAYNNLMNRTQECMNRLAYPIVLAEDGSIDVDNLEEEGLTPGKVLIYRQGSEKPTFFTNSTSPEVTVIDNSKSAQEVLLKEFDEVVRLFEETLQAKENKIYKLVMEK